jgi:homoserine dehydrogenase
VSQVAWSTPSRDPLSRPYREAAIRSPRPAVRRVRVGLLGCGRIGQAVVWTAQAERDRLAAAGVELTFVRALVRDLGKPRQAAVPVLDAPDRFAVDDLDVVIEVLGGLEPALSIVARALVAGVAVVTANKTLVAHHGEELDRLARQHAAVLAYDAAVLAGVPFLGSLARRPLLSGAHGLAGIVNGTSHAITTALEAGAPFDAALADAVRRGYAEPDSAADISGRDAAEKLTILLRLAGVGGVRVASVPTIGIDTLTSDDFCAARALGGTIKPVALARLDDDQPGTWVGPAFVDRTHPLGRTTGVTNVLQISGAAGRHALDVPDVIFEGPGAGPSATAATIIDDVIEALDARPARRPAAARPACDVSQPTVGPWFVRLTRAGEVGSPLAVLTDAGLSIVRADPATTAVLTGPTTGRAVDRLAALARARGWAIVAFPACLS